MKDSYVSESQAILLNQLGFPLFEFHYEDPMFNYYGQFPNFGNVEKNQYYLIPTQSLAQKWLREEKNLFIWVKPYTDKINQLDNHYWELIIDHTTTNHSKSYIRKKIYETYEQAISVGIDKSIEILINSSNESNQVTFSEDINDLLSMLPFACRVCSHGACMTKEYSGQCEHYKERCESINNNKNEM